MRLSPVVVALMLAGCSPGADAAPAGRRSLPPIGLAVVDSNRAWCAEFVADSTAPALEPGRHVTLVFAGPAAVPAWGARVGVPHPAECPAAFPQPRWIGYVAYRLALSDSLPADSGATPSVALVVASEAHWTRGADGVVRADLDGDGEPEEARRCTAGEGEHLTLWSLRPGGSRVRRWHEYYDWGGLTDPTCQPGEDGEEPSIVGAPGKRGSASAGGSDSGFAALQRRGGEAMGVDQYTSTHVFEPLPDGGRIVLRRVAADPAGVATIRVHMRMIASRFAQGDFTIPGIVHAQAVPGAEFMAAHRDAITYTPDTLPGGGQVRITTTDPAAVAAVHEFLAFQRRDHRAPAHEHEHASGPGPVDEHR
jgi:hypothetical protein